MGRDMIGRDVIKGTGLVLTASILFGISPSFTTKLLQDGYTRESLMFIRFLFTALSAAAIAGVSKTSFHVSRRQVLELILFGVFGWGMTSILLAMAYECIPSGLATMFHFTYPVIVLLCGVLFFRESLTREKAAAVAVSVLGISLILDLSGNFSIKGVGFALASAVSYSAFVIAGKRCSFSSLPSIMVPYYCGLFCTAAFGIYAVSNGTFMLPGNVSDGLLMAALGIFCSAGACWLLTEGIRILGPSKAAVLNTLEPVTSMVLGVWMLGEEISFRKLTGCFLIVCAIILTTKRQ